MYYKLNIKALNITMLNRGYSINKLSKECGVGKSTISRILKEQSIARPETIFKIARALEVDVQDLIEEEQ